MFIRPPKVSFWNDPKIRSALVQIIMVLVVGFFIYEIVDNTITNLTKRNISTGFRIPQQIRRLRSHPDAYPVFK